MIDARFVPIDKWPGSQMPSYKRKASPFRAVYSNTLDLLEAELGHLNAKDITIQAYFERREIRNDGWPRSSARPSQPGVIVSFTRKTTWNSARQVHNTEEMSIEAERQTAEIERCHSGRHYKDLIADAVRLKDIIANAPHEDCCLSGPGMAVSGVHRCDCWKSKVAK